MPCLLTNSWKPGVTVSEAASCYPIGCAVTDGIRGYSLALLHFLNVCNTTSEVSDLRAEEEPQQLELKSYFMLLNA